MTICYFGIYQKDYPRNNILIEGLRQNGVKVLECQDRSRGLKKYWNLFRKHNKIKRQYDVMIVGFSGQLIMFLAKIISRKPIILDTFVSLYDTAVFDRQTCGFKSIKARYFYFLDKYSCKLADKCLLDTNEHINYFVKTFNLPKDNFARILVGSNNKIFYPRDDVKKNTDKFLVHFHGYIVPFHGVEYIVKAAKLLENENILFRFFVRFDKKFQEIRKILEDLNVFNVDFKNLVSYEELAGYINKADVSLGVFGKTPKINKVIPNKIYEALACKTPVVTSGTPAVTELLEDNKNCLLTKPGDEKDIADKILKLKNNDSLRKEIAENGYGLYLKKATPEILAEKLINEAEKIIKQK